MTNEEKQKKESKQKEWRWVLPDSAFIDCWSYFTVSSSTFPFPRSLLYEIIISN